jgi:hypothetical protein
MKRLVCTRVSPSMVVATGALLVALGGTGIAASTVLLAPENSVNSAAVIDHSLLKKDFKTGQLPRGQRGSRGSIGPAGATGATGATGSAGTAGPKGDAGANFTPATTLPSGQTERGGYDVWGGGVGNFVGTAINYRIPLAQAIPAGNAHFVTGSAFTTQCPAVGQAAAGHVCVYEETHGNTAFGAIYSQYDGVQTVGASSVVGFQIYFTTSATGAFSYGEWAVTAA